MYRSLNNINEYILYLKNECHLHTSIHFHEKRLAHVPERYLRLLLKYNAHENFHCMKVKSILGSHQKCVLAQKQILESQKTEYYCFMCHADIYQFVGPIREKGRVVGFVAVSGYKEEKDIPKRMCEILIPPLCSMLEQFLERCVEEDNCEYNLMLQYLNEYHAMVSLENLSRHFGRSKSYISHMFKKTGGMSVREYCNHLKLEDAKRILLSSDRSVTEISLEVGFQDVSYFVNLFKKRYGNTPLQYRKQYKKES